MPGAIDNMTIYSHIVVMKSTKVADLKAHLSAYLREVRRGGEILILDRATPIAKMIPYREKGRGLVISPPRMPLTKLRGVQGVRPKVPFDPVEALTEDRGRR